MAIILTDDQRAQALIAISDDLAMHPSVQGLILEFCTGDRDPGKYLQGLLNADNVQLQTNIDGLDAEKAKTTATLEKAITDNTAAIAELEKAIVVVPDAILEVPEPIS